MWAKERHLLMNPTQSSTNLTSDTTRPVTWHTYLATNFISNWNFWCKIYFHLTFRVVPVLRLSCRVLSKLNLVLGTLIYVWFKLFEKVKDSFHDVAFLVSIELNLEWLFLMVLLAFILYWLIINFQSEMNQSYHCALNYNYWLTIKRILFNISRQEDINNIT